jgi:hypothetical protein
MCGELGARSGEKERMEGMKPEAGDLREESKRRISHGGTEP